MPPDHIPNFEDQGLRVTRIPNDLLSGVPTGARFNGAIIEWRGRRIMAYRQYNPLRKMQTVPPDAKARGEKVPPQARDIGISALGADWMPTGEHYVPHFPIRHGDACYEDPRLFIFQDRLYLGVVEFNPLGQGWCVNQRLFRLNDEFQIEHAINIHVGQNFGNIRSCEKNWTYFETTRKVPYKKDTYPNGPQGPAVVVDCDFQFHSDPCLVLLYNVQEMQTHEIHPKTGDVLHGWIDRKIIWPFGHMRGGTCPLPLPDDVADKYGVARGSFLKFVHNSTDHEWSSAGGTRRYSMSAVVFAAEPPFRILKISASPVIWGTRHEAFCGHGNSQCVFPAGVILSKDAWHVSAGINDTFNAIFHLEPDAVMSGLVDAEEFYHPHYRYFHTTTPNAVACIIGRERPWSAPTDASTFGRITKSGGAAQEGIIATQDPFTIADLMASANAKEMTYDQFEKARLTVDLPANAVARPALPTPKPTSSKPKSAMTQSAQPPTMSISINNPQMNPQPPVPTPTATASSPPSPVPAPPKGPAVPPQHVPQSYGLFDGIEHYNDTMDGWSTSGKCCRMAGDVLGQNADITVDLGTYGGRGAVALACAHRQLGHGICHAVDAWDHDVCLEGCTNEANRKWWAKPGTPGKVGDLDLEKIYQNFLGHVRGHHLQDDPLHQWLTVHRMRSDEAAKLFEDGTVSVLHFDGNHSEEVSARDMALWMPKVKPQGYLYFDDTDWSEDGGKTVSTAKAQKMLEDASWHMIHREPKSEKSGEWKCYQCPAYEDHFDTFKGKGPKVQVDDSQAATPAVALAQAQESVSLTNLVAQQAMAASAVIGLPQSIPVALSEPPPTEEAAGAAQPLVPELVNPESYRKGELEGDITPPEREIAPTQVRTMDPEKILALGELVRPMMNRILIHVTFSALPEGSEHKPRFCARVILSKDGGDVHDENAMVLGEPVSVPILDVQDRASIAHSFLHLVQLASMKAASGLLNRIEN